MSYPIPGPLPDVGPPLGQPQDGSKPGMTYAGGTWQFVNGVDTLVPPFLPPGGFEVK